MLYPGGGGHSYSKVDMMLVHGIIKSTLNKYKGRIS